MKRKTFGSLFSSSGNASPELCQAIEQLDRLVQERPSLSQPAAALRELLPILFAAPTTERFEIADDEAKEKLSHGTPLLRGEALEINARDFQQRWRAICRTLELRRADTAASKVAALAGRNEWRTEQIVSLVLDGKTEEVFRMAEAAGVESELAMSVVRFALLPVLSGIRESIAPLVAATNWSGGFCPVCGSWPFLAEYRGLEQTRFLRCGVCFADWQFPRLLCPYCKNRDHRQLGYFHVEGEQDRFRVATCDTCRGYVKTAFTLGPLNGPQLLAMDLATMHLDVAAVDRGLVKG